METFESNHFDYQDSDTEETFYNEQKSSVDRKKILDFIHNVSFSIITQLTNSNFPSIIIRSKGLTPFLRHLNFSNPNNTEQIALYVKLLSLIQKLIERDQYATKRDLFYQLKPLFKTQASLDSLLNDLARTIQVPRSSLHILTTPKGQIAGYLELITADGNVIKFKDTREATAIPNFLDSIKDIRTNAKFVLIIEKDSTLQRFLDDNFLQKYPGVLITGKGEPDINTRRFVNMLYKKFKSKMKFLCLTDANPYGILISSVYKYGSREFSYDKDLNVSSLEWIGLKLSDLENFHLKNKNNFLLQLNDRDKTIAKNLIAKFEKLNEHELINEVTLI
ncbi:unnamed protein product [Brachionus calyciflorus]|uniref:DNA topoisomerase (ATP-hydrolyzing) n=1 Tax=Brachionus calyciflorus TaxID=104777 RepID=A0A814BLR5_9BILA|nr:unnamed protein product [Brachionus calyciflorus]